MVSRCGVGVGEGVGGAFGVGSAGGTLGVAEIAFVDAISLRGRAALPHALTNAISMSALVTRAEILKRFMLVLSRGADIFNAPAFGALS